LESADLIVNKCVFVICSLLDVHKMKTHSADPVHLSVCFNTRSLDRFWRNWVWV